MTKTLVIHPKDRSTDFLKPIYQNIPDVTLVVGSETYEDPRKKINVKDIHKLIEEHDRVIMLGHGCPDGLFSMGRFADAYGLVISDRTVELLREKKDNIYIWCNANEFVERYGLTGFYSGMFISEVGEAYAMGLDKQSQKVVNTSNDTFSEILSRYANEPSSVIHENVVREYSVLAESNEVASFNNKRLYLS